MNDFIAFLPMLIVVPLAALTLVSIWVVFTKAGKPGWACLVPVYNMVVLLEIAGKPLWWFILFFVPIVNVVVGFSTYIGLAHRFGKGTGFGIGLILLSFIFFPMLAFGDARYLGSAAGDSRLSKGAIIAIGLAGSAFVLLPVLAAIAIPAFMTYQRKAQTTEAEQLLRAIAMGARMHQEMAAPGGAPALESVGPTPPAGSCCQGVNGKCAPDPALWDHPTWQALGFSIQDSHRYSYQYEVTDGGKGFVARALGDLDCDGLFSTFELTGASTDDGSMPNLTIERIYEKE